MFQLAIDGVHHQPLGHGIDEGRRTIDQLRPEFHHAIDRNSIRQDRARVNRSLCLSVNCSPGANRIEVLKSQSGRIDHAWGARRDSHGDLPLPPTTYLRQVYLDTVVFSYHQLAYLIDVFGPDRIVMGTDYPFDMAEYNPIGHVAGVHGMDESTLAQIVGGNAARVLNLDV